MLFHLEVVEKKLQNRILGPILLFLTAGFASPILSLLAVGQIAEKKNKISHFLLHCVINTTKALLQA